MMDSKDNSTKSADQIESEASLYEFLQYTNHPDEENKISEIQKNTSLHNLLKQGIKTLYRIKNVVIVNSEELIGSSYSNPELRKDGGIICRILTAGNLVDAVCSQGVLSFAFAGTPYGLGWALSLTTNILILKIKNDAGVAIVRARPGTLPTRSIGLFSLLGLSAISCIVSGVGTELTLNQSGLADVLASQIIAKEKVRITALKPDTSLYDRAQTECDESKKQLDQLPGKGARHDTKHVLTYGTFAERNREWKLTESGIPLCVKADLLKQQVVEQSGNLSKNWEKQMSNRSQIGNDLEFLRLEMPGQHKKYFTDNGEFRSGVLAIELASQSFYSKLSKGDFAGLGASLFFSSLSIVTTVAACGAVIAFPSNLDAKLSWEGRIARERDRILYQEISKKVKADNVAK
jgi:hypothetical protein